MEETARSGWQTACLGMGTAPAQPLSYTAPLHQTGLSYPVLEFCTPCMRLLRREQAGWAGLARQNMLRAQHHLVHGTQWQREDARCAEAYPYCQNYQQQQFPGSAEGKYQSRAVSSAALRLQCTEMKV